MITTVDLSTATRQIVISEDIHYTFAMVGRELTDTQIDAFAAAFTAAAIRIGTEQDLDVEVIFASAGSPESRRETLTDADDEGYGVEATIWQAAHDSVEVAEVVEGFDA